MHNYYKKYQKFFPKISYSYPMLMQFFERQAIIEKTFVPWTFWKLNVLKAEKEWTGYKLVKFSALYFLSVSLPKQ